MTLCALLATLTGAALIYLASTQQRLRAVALSAWARAAGWLFVLAGATVWRISAGVGAGIASALTTVMLTWVTLPYLAWWRAATAETSKP